MPLSVHFNGLELSKAVQTTIDQCSPKSKCYDYHEAFFKGSLNAPRPVRPVLPLHERR